MDASRRTFLTIVFGGLQAVIAMLLAVPFLGYLLGPLFRKRETRWVDAGKLADLTAADPVRGRVQYTSDDGFREVQKTEGIWVQQEGERLVVHSSTCPHLGCKISWRAEDGEFHCPCHDARFDRTGKVLAGPPAEPMKRLNARVEDGILKVEV